LKYPEDVLAWRSLCRKNAIFVSNTIAAALIISKGCLLYIIVHSSKSRAARLPYNPSDSDSFLKKTFNRSFLGVLLKVTVKP